MVKKKTNVIKKPVIKKFRLDEINPAKYNPKVISDEALAGLGKSLERFGYVEPIVVNVRGGRNIIVGGHQRHKALLTMYKPCESIDCITVDLDAKEEKLLNLALNNPEIQGQFIDTISEYIEQLKAEMPDDTGFIDLRINELIGEIEEVKETEVSIPDEQYNICVECIDENQQKECFELLREKGYKCRLLTI